MMRAEMLDDLREFVVTEMLDGREAGLDAHTPLLAWGVLDSLSVNALVSYTNEHFGIDVPPDDVTPENLKDLDAYVSLLERVG